MQFRPDNPTFLTQPAYFNLEAVTGIAFTRPPGQSEQAEVSVGGMDSNDVGTVERREDVARLHALVNQQPNRWFAAAGPGPQETEYYDLSRVVLVAFDAHASRPVAHLWGGRDGRSVAEIATVTDAAAVRKLRRMMASRIPVTP